MKPPSPIVIPDNLDSTVPTMTKEEMQKYRALAKDMLRDASESTIFACGMAPLDYDDPLYDIFQCDPSLNCGTLVEADFYTSRIMPRRIELCCHCTSEFDSPVELNSNLKAPEDPYSVVLAVCKVRLENGCNIIIRAARQSAKAKQARIVVAAARKAGRQEREVEAAATAAAIAVATSAPTFATLTSAATSAAISVGTSAPKPKTRKRTRCVCLYLLSLPLLLLLNFVASLYK
jgi:hypothetical protein